LTENAIALEAQIARAFLKFGNFDGNFLYGKNSLL